MTGSEEEDGHFFAVLAGGEDHETAEQNLENEARQGGFSFFMSPIDAKGEEA